MISQDQARAQMFTDQASMAAFFKAYEKQTGPMLAYCESVMGADSSLTMAEKYLLGAYVSELNHCTHCRHVQESAALSCGVDEGVLNDLLGDKAPLDPRLMCLFKYAQKLALAPHLIGVEDSQAVFNHGWPKEALADVVHIVGLFSLLTRLIEGFNIRPEASTSISMGTYLAREGYAGMAVDHGLESPYQQLSAPDGTPSLQRISRDSDHMIPGVIVRLKNLSREAHNGKTARVLEYVPHADNWRVELQNAMVIRVKADNCYLDSEADDNEYIPPSSASAESKEVEIPEIGTVSSEVRKVALARNRFQRIESRLLKDFSTTTPLSNCSVILSEKFEEVHFKIDGSWDKGRKALFAKTYTRHYKDGQHRLRVVIIDSDDQKNGKTAVTFDN
eukprot:TRINITY_DN1648_c2_g2_i1.p1 TRINITY_DN1648_c2_g2~~TRINITY_DN1648_c2_g2_i1.p1  ORF type:complete len:390 (+),score=38.93 TRINITY_DN1648_c2_g2_i1:85-1254(+)